MNNLKISTRLDILIGVRSLLLLGIGGIGLYGIVKTDDSLKTVLEDHTVPLGQVEVFQGQLLCNRLLIANSLVTPAPDYVARNAAEVEDNIAAIGKIWEPFLATTLTLAEGSLAKAFAENRGKFVQDGLVLALEALRANDVDAAKRVATLRDLGIVRTPRDRTMLFAESRANSKRAEIRFDHRRRRTGGWSRTGSGLDLAASRPACVSIGTSGTPGLRVVRGPLNSCGTGTS